MIFSFCSFIFPEVVVLVENVTAPGSEISVRKVGVQHDEALGAYHFDLQLFEHFAAKVAGPKVSSYVRRREHTYFNLTLTVFPCRSCLD